MVTSSAAIETTRASSPENREPDTMLSFLTCSRSPGEIPATLVSGNTVTIVADPVSRIASPIVPAALMYSSSAHAEKSSVPLRSVIPDRSVNAESHR